MQRVQIRLYVHVHVTVLDNFDQFMVCRYFVCVCMCVCVCVCVRFVGTLARSHNRTIVVDGVKRP